MFRFLAKCLILLLIADPLFASAANKGEIKPSQSQTFLNSAPVVTITNLDVLAGDALQRDRDNKSMTVDSILYKSQSDESGINISRDQFYDFFNQQKNSNTSMQSQLTLFNSGKKLVGAFADAGGPIGIFAFTAGDTYLDRFNEQLRKDMEDSYRSLSEQYFAGRTLDIDRLKTAEAAGTSAFVKEMETQAGLPDAFADLTGERRDDAIIRLGEFTLANAALQGQQFAAAQTANKVEFDRIEGRINHIKDCQQAISSGMNELMVQTNDNTQELADISRQLDDQHKDLGLIQQAMFSHLSVDEQLRLVQNSTALDLTDEQRQALANNLEKRKILLDNAQKWNDFVHTGTDLLGIAAKLGVDQDIVQNISKGFSAGDTAYSAVNAALSGNYLGAVNAVLGLFGGGGMDAETAHYTAIMAKLDEIVETQKKIIAIQQQILSELGKIESLIIQNQIELRGTLESIFWLQATTLAAVVQIKQADLNSCTKFLDDRYVDDGFLKKENRFRDYDSMRSYFAHNWQLYASCRQALDQSVATISGPHGIFFGYPVLEQEATRIQSASLVAVLEPIHNAIAPFFAYLAQYVPDTDRDKKTVVGSFFAPSLDFGSLREKERIVEAGSTSGPNSTRPATPTTAQQTPPAQTSVTPAKKDENPLSTEAATLQTLRPISTLRYPADNPAVNMFYANFDTELLSPDALIEYADVEVQVNSFRELTSLDGQALLTSAEIYQGKGHKASSEIALKAAFDWLTLGIAQQSFLDGDTLLPFLNADGFADYTPPDKLTLRELIKEPATKDIAHDQQLALAHYLLGHNPVLAANAIRYRIFKQMSVDSAGTRLTAFGYGWAYTHPEDPVFMQTLLKDVAPVQYVEHKGTDGPDVPPTGWYMKYDFTEYTDLAPQAQSIMIPLPPIEDVAQQTFVVSNALRRLIECRNRINSLLAADHVVDEASSQRRNFTNLKLLLLMQHYRPQGVPVGGLDRADKSFSGTFY